MDGKVLGIEVFPGLPFPDQAARAVHLADHVRIHHFIGAVGRAPGHALGKARRHGRAGRVQQMAVGQPLRVVVMGRVLVAPDHLAFGRDLVEVAAMPHGPGRIEIGRVRMISVVAQVAIGQDHGVAACAHGQLPFVGHAAFDVYQVDMAVGGLGSDQRIAAGAEGGIVGDETRAAAALGDLVDGGGHAVLSETGSGNRRHSRSPIASGIAVCF